MNNIKRVAIALLCLLIISGRPACVDASSYTKGDLNGDGKISALDYVIIVKYLNSEKELDPSFLDALDVNSDGAIDQNDAERLKNIVYYKEVEDLGVSVASKTIHSGNQAKFLAEGYKSITKYGSSGGDTSKPIYLEYGPEVIPEGSTYTIMVSEDPDMANAKSYTSSNRSIRIDNSKVRQIYFWTVNNGSNTSDLQAFYVDDVPVRNLSNGTIGNARDIGGFETEDGYIVKQGMIFRGHQMSDNDLSKNRKILVDDLGIKTEIDIKENKSIPQIASGTKYLARYMYFTPYGDYLKNSYPKINSIRKIFDDLADENNYPVYIHCHIGADRTGVMCFLFNALCGASLEDCYTDYVFTSFSGDQRTSSLISGNYVAQILGAEGRTLAEKTYNTLVSVGVNPDSLDKFIQIMREKKPSSKTYVDIPKAKETALHFDGEEKQLKLSEDDYLFTVKGNKATEIGDYTAVLSLKDPSVYSWSDGSKSDKMIEWNIDDIRQSVSMPDISIGEYVYTGEEIEVPVEEKEYYCVDGNKATEAGDYQFTLSLSDRSRYVWADGSYEDLTYDWSIAKADVDLSGFHFEDLTVEYDGTEKQLVYEGELPAGINSLVYSDNILVGDPFVDSKTEATLSFVLENENYNKPEDLKAVLTITPIYSDLIIRFKDSDLQEMQIPYGEAYELPVPEKEDYSFNGWYMEIDGEYIPVEQEGVWKYTTKQREVTLIPVFTYNANVETRAQENDEQLILDINEEGNDGIALIVESENELNNDNLEEGNVVALYQMNSNGHFEFEKKDRPYFYLVKDGEIICRFDQENSNETD